MISEKNDTGKNPVNSISPEERIKLLEIQEDSLKNKKNPHSLTDKSVKEIVTEGLVEGTVAVLFGRDAEELEIQREKDEYEWEQNRTLKLQELNKELDFWNNSELLPGIIPPKNDIIGRVLFPVLPDTKEIEIEIPLQNTVFDFRFKKPVSRKL